MAGNIIEAQNTYGKTLYQYDKGGRLIYQKDVTTGEEISFEYDAAGNRTRLYSSNRDTSYAYGSNNEVKEIFDNKQRVSVKLAYNKNGSEVLRKFGNGTSEETLYDKAGRVIVRLQKSERNELLWAEGYVYGDEGKRTATVDNAGRLTLYEYNKKGQLEKVYYPYTQELIDNLKKEAEENGLPTNIDIGENQYLNSDLRSKVVPLLNAMQYGLAYSLPNMQSFIKESYGYDGNGNRIGKTTKYGTINYSYDKENCLTSSGSRGQAFVNYTYDNAGNLLTEESANRTTKYAYNAQNRLIYCEVLDKAEKTYAQTTYAYDALGRRVLVQDKDEVALRTLYDGLTFDVIKQSPVMANGLFTDSAETGIRWSPTGKPTGDRYRYISDEEAKDDNRYFYLDENTYKTVNTRYRGTRTAITVNGTVTAQITGEGSQYFTTDLLGSVSSVTDSYGSQKASYTYDAFGTLIQGDLIGTTDIGYLGKQNDQTAGLYNYGYRDYKPASARFTSQDPIRDGMNWYAYCDGDPINYIDENGLETTDKKKPAIYPTAGNAFNLDFGRDYSNMAVQNFKNGHPILGTIQMLDSACEIVYDLAAAYGCANVIGAFVAAPTALPEKSESWLQSNGKPNYPPNNGAVLGTEVNQTLEVGTKIGRYGEIGPNSSFVTDTVSTASELSLPPWTDPSTYQEFTVIKPIVNVVGAEVEAWAGSTGGGMQYVLPQTIIQLQQEGYIK